MGIFSLIGEGGHEVGEASRPLLKLLGPVSSCYHRGGLDAFGPQASALSPRTFQIAPTFVRIRAGYGLLNANRSFLAHILMRVRAT